MRVSIYTHTTAKGPKKKITGYGYVIECITSKGPATLSHIGTFTDETKNRADLRCLIEALRKLNKACDLVIFTTPFTAAVVNTWLSMWEKNGWKDSKQVEIYKELKNLLKPHFYSAKTDVNPYTEWLSRETEKEEEKAKCLKP